MSNRRRHLERFLMKELIAIIIGLTAAWSIPLAVLMAV
ncbi:hypothetical protein GGE07_004023 [Sinorhizobium terangae]|nr:hypothetical protein [Sinorhizobium terangae]